MVCVVVVAVVTGGVTTVVEGGCTLVVQLLRERMAAVRANALMMVFTGVLGLGYWAFFDSSQWSDFSKKHALSYGVGSNILIFSHERRLCVSLVVPNSHFVRE